METKRLVLAVALSALVLVVWTKLFPPPERPAQPAVMPIETATPLDIGYARPETTPGSPDEIVDAAIDPAAVIVADVEEIVRVTTDRIDVELTNVGGAALSWKLREYGRLEGEPLDVFPRFEEPATLPLSLDLDDISLSDVINQARFVVTRETLDPEGARGRGEKVTFEWSDGRGLQVTKVFSFREREYLVDVDIEVLDRGRRLESRLVVGPGFGAQEVATGRSNYYYDGQAIWNVAGQVTRNKRGKLDDENGFSGPLRWAGLDDQYFAVLVLPGSERGQVRWRSAELTLQPLDGEDSGEGEPETQPLLAISIAESGGQIYVGPKNYRLLQSLGGDLETAVWFSSVDWLAWIVRQIYFGLLWLQAHVVSNFGMAIILATMMLRIILFPVNQFSMVSMKKTQLQMQRLQPKIKAIKNKYKKQKDAQARSNLNRETMELYKREGVNPMGGITGCLPMLAQFPILIGFYNMLTVAVDLRGAPFFGWIQDLSLEDPLYVTPLLMGVTMFTQQKLAMSKIKDPQQLQQQRFMLFMPVMFTIICVNMPSGLVLYWFVNNLLGIGQQYLVNRHTGRLEAAAHASPKSKAKA